MITRFYAQHHLNCYTIRKLHFTMNRFVSAELGVLGLTWSDAIFVQMYLADMAHFGAANEAYSQHLPSVDPPARACVQLQLDSKELVAFEITLRSEPAASGRRVLHVQSISSWAPASIGPYSQVRIRCNPLLCSNSCPRVDDGESVLALDDILFNTAGCSVGRPDYNGWSDWLGSCHYAGGEW